ncbi:hypothetical protein PM93_002 [Staphylococcus phage PM93]|nr:hypothetical protein PM93_002 [Staphylococcus phage PM93]
MNLSDKELIDIMDNVNSFTDISEAINETMQTNN